MGKAQFPTIMGWQTTSPVTAFRPGPGPGQSVAGNSPSNGSTAGTMTGTNTIYTNIVGIRQMDNVGLEITYTGTPTGVISVMVSNSGIVFYPLTFSPALTQPAGAAGGYSVALMAIPFQYMYVQYVNTSGTGSISPVYAQLKANNP